ncbi:MAG: LpqB family beta-propeller domain-containing protein [Cyanobacteria bacterium P01_G01_bin.54]
MTFYHQFWGLAVLGLVLLTACDRSPTPIQAAKLNSRFTEDQPAISGDGRIVAFMTNRHGAAELAVYDLEREQFWDVSVINAGNNLIATPSLSRTGRYIVYVVSDRGGPAIALYDQAVEQVEILSRQYRGWVRNPQISPDGRYITFETARRGQWDIEILDRGPNVELDLADGTVIEP